MNPLSSLAQVWASPAWLTAGLVAVFVGLAALLGAAVSTPTAERTAVRRSLASIEALRRTPRSLREQVLQTPLARRTLDPVLHAATRLGARLTPQNQVARIRRRLDLAGNPSAWDVDRVVSLKVLSSFTGTSLTALVCLVADIDLLPSALAVVVVGVTGWFTPSMVIYQLAYNRSQRILKDLPDAMDLLTISVESGLSFDAALAQVARNSEGPLAEEFFRVLQEMQIGTGRMDALRAVSERTDVMALRSFVSAMVQADSYGVPIASALRVQADEMRVRRSQRAEEAAQRVPVKILFPLIFGILPTLFVVIIGPGVIRAFYSFQGV